MKKQLTNNIGLKLLALCISFMLWLVVVNYDDPIISYTYSGIQVDVTNADSLRDKGKVYEILNNTDTISVTLTGKRSIVESISKENIKAVADLEDITLMNTVQIRVTTNKNFDLLEDARSDTPSLELNIEDLMETHLPITVVCDGAPQDGYVAGDISTTQNTVRVSGPASVVSNIESAQCLVSVNGRTSDITTSSDIVFVDSNNNVVEHDNLSSNIRSINVSVAILPTKAVEIIYDYSGVPADEYVVNGDLTGDRQAVYIAGRQSALDSVNVITVPATAINVDGKDTSFTTVVDLSKYLPEGIRFADSEFDGRVAVTVDIEKTVNRTLNVPVSNLSIVNIPDGYSAEMFINNEIISTTDDDVTMRVPVSGVQQAFENVTGKDITGVIDIEAYLLATDRTILPAGMYQMDIDFNMPEGITATENSHADIKITVNN